MLGLRGASVAARFPRRRIVNLLVVLAVIGTVVALAVTRSGVPASAMRLLAGDVWLENASAGTVSHVNGYSGATDAQATVGKAGDPFEVVQRQGGAFVLDLRTGRLSRLDDSGLNVTTSATEPTPAKALQVITGTKATWILDKSSGVLQQVNPTTLKPIGHQIALGGRTGTAVVDGSGSIWVPLLSGAGVDEVNPDGALTHHAFGRAGDVIELAYTSRGVWALDTHAKRVASLSTPTAHSVSLPALAKAPIVGASASSPDLVLVSGDQVLNIDTAQPSLSSLALPAAAASVTQVAVSSGQAYLLDPQTHRLDTVNLSPMGIAASTPVPTGADQLVTKDQLVFVNSTSAPQALVVNPDGAVTNLTKYNPRVPPQSNNQGQGFVPSTNPTPNASPTTAPQTAPAGTNPSASETSPTAPSFTGPPPSDQMPTPSGPPAPTPPGPGLTAPPTTAAPPATPAPTSPTRRVPPTTAPPSTTTTTVAPTTTTTVAPTTTTSAPPAPPGVPTNIRVTAGIDQITVTWSPPASGGSSPVTHYVVTGSPNNASTSVTGTTATIPNLPSGTQECVQVQAVNAANLGGPLSPANTSCATPLAPPPPAAVPNQVTGLSVSGGDKEVILNWAAASVPAGSPPVTGYQVTVGGQMQPPTTNTSLTVPEPAWTTENVSVRAVNSVGPGSAATGSYATWTRSGTVTCVNSLSGDRSVQNDCTNVVSDGAWTQTSSSISWIDPQGHIPSGDGFEWLCATYETGGISGDVYAIVSSPTETACTNALPGYQAPDTPHVIAAISTTKSLPGGQHVCEYKGTTTGSSGKYTSEELSSSCTVPSGLAGASEVASFYT